MVVVEAMRRERKRGSKDRLDFVRHLNLVVRSTSEFEAIL